jgi:transporter family protein
MNWLISSLVAMVCWGLWGLLLKLASKYFNWQQTFVVTSIVTLTASLLVFLWLKPVINVGSTGFGYAMAAGVSGLVALLAFYSAIGSGKAIIVVPLTALYPVVTTILSYLVLREEISLTKGLGIVLALVALLLVSID